jgi:peptidoglycan/LPS O-acetylase OafA/YrhL
MTAIQYRREIDGLRAIAVLPVILFHLNLPWLQGGFLGVDVFFVISGYLITSIIKGDLDRGTFSLREFWARRVRRILPALLVVTAVTLGASYAFGFLPEQQAVGVQALTALFSSANLYFWWTASDYWAGAAEGAPFLHAWSLAVEEQFYMLFPVAIWGVHRLRPAWVFPVIVAGGTASLLAYGAYHASFPTATFYLAPFRAWELAAGCALATAPALWRERLGRRAGLATLGLTLLLACFVGFDGLGMGPVMATAGTFLVLAAGRAGFAHRVLSARPLVHVGRISYSLYLWHWPLIVLADNLGLRWNGPTDQVALLALTFLLAAGSYRWVESPTRRARSGPGPILIAAVLPAAAGLVMASHMRVYDASAYEEVQFISYSPNPTWEPARGPRVLGARMSNPGYWPDVLANGGIRVGDEWGDPSVAVIGDSHAEMWSHTIATIARRARVPTAFFSQAGESWWSVGYDHADSQVFHWLVRYRPRVIVIALAWRTIDPAGLEPVMNLAASLGARVLLVEDPPWLGPCGNRSASQWLASKGIQPSAGVLKYLSFDDEGTEGRGRATVRQLAEGYDHAVLVETFEAYASEAGFLVLDGDIPVYLDDDHLSAHGADQARPRLRTSILSALDIP